MEWERLRYLATMVYNVNANKRSQMIEPEKLFKLPQDVYAQLEKSKPKSNREQYESFLKRVSEAKSTSNVKNISDILK